jgi:hypothetical protein
MDKNKNGYGGIGRSYLSSRGDRVRSCNKLS